MNALWNQSTSCGIPLESLAWWLYRFHTVAQSGQILTVSWYMRDTIGNANRHYWLVYVIFLIWQTYSWRHSSWLNRNRITRFWNDYPMFPVTPNWDYSLGPSDAIWRWRFWSTLVPVMTCCLTAPSHYLHQCWLIIRKVLWHSSEDIIISRFEDTNQLSNIEDYTF